MLGWCTTVRFLHGLQRNTLYVTKMHFVFDPRSMLACWKESPFWHSQTLRLFGHIWTALVTPLECGPCTSTVKVVEIPSGWCLDYQKQSLIEQVPRKVHDTHTYYVLRTDVTFHGTFGTFKNYAIPTVSHSVDRLTAFADPWCLRAVAVLSAACEHSCYKEARGMIPEGNFSAWHITHITSHEKSLERRK